MVYRALADFLEALADGGQLARVAAEVDPRRELAEIARRSARAAGPALLFDRVRGCPLPIVANLLATEDRACRALGIGSLAELAERTESLVRQGGAQGWLERLKLAPEQPVSERYRAKSVRSAPCQQIVRRGRDIDLAPLAALQSWEAESQGSMTAVHLVTSDAVGTRRLTPCRLQYVDSTRLAIVDDGLGDWTRLAQAAQVCGEKLYLAMFLGGDPAYSIAAAVPGSEMLDAYALLGLVRGAVVETVKCKTSALEVPADVDIVLEGIFDPAADPARVTVSGVASPYYRPAIEAPVIQIETLTQRSSCLLPVRLDSEAEIAVLRKAVERMLLPLVRAAIPELIDYALPIWGGGDRFAFLAIRKTIALQARRAASALWGLPAFQSTKFVVLVDEDVDVQDFAQVWSRVGANVDPARDTFVRPGPAAPADHAFAVPQVGCQMGIDATGKLPGEVASNWPAALTVSQEIRDLVDRRWKEYGL